MENLYRVAFENHSSNNQRYITILKEDYHKIYPKTVARKISYLFLDGYVLLFKVKVAEFLIEKFRDLVVYDKVGNNISRKDDLDLLNKNELIFEAQKLLIDFTNKNEFELKLNIRELRKEKKRKTA